jgi:hypothetical protein
MTKLYDKVFHGDVCCVCYQPAHDENAVFDRTFAHEICYEKCDPEFQIYLSKVEKIEIEYKIIKLKKVA